MQGVVARQALWLANSSCEGNRMKTCCLTNPASTAIGSSLLHALQQLMGRDSPFAAACCGSGATKQALERVQLLLCLCLVSR